MVTQLSTYNVHRVENNTYCGGVLVYAAVFNGGACGGEMGRKYSGVACEGGHVVLAFVRDDWLV